MSGVSLVPVALLERHRCQPALNRLARRCCSCGQAEVEPRPRWPAGLGRRGLLLLEQQASGSRTVEAEADSTATHEPALPPSARERSLSVPCLNPRYLRTIRGTRARGLACRKSFVCRHFVGHDKPIDCLPCRRSRVRIPRPPSPPELLSPEDCLRIGRVPAGTPDLKLGGFAGEFRSRRTVVILRPPQKTAGSDRACCVTIERDL
jgi:hypothetical protein